MSIFDRKQFESREQKFNYETCEQTLFGESLQNENDASTGSTVVYIDVGEGFRKKREAAIIAELGRKYVK